MRTFAGSLAAFAVTAVAGSAAAGDTASLSVLGYSPDGKVFAFEEYGIFDGSGFPYSNIYFIDTIEDKFLPGTPIRVRIDEEGSLGKVRDMSRAKAADLASKYRLADNPGVIVAYNPTSEIDSDPHKIRFYPWVSGPPFGYSNTLALTEKDFPISPRCAGFAEGYKGFKLTLTEYRGQDTNTVLHDDTNVPNSRNCANAYRIGAVVSSEIREVTMVAMILVGSFGYEGDDWRWIAVPIQPYGH